METLVPFLETVRTFFGGIFSGISSHLSIDLGIKLVLGYLFVIWGAFVIWVIKDITNRTTNILVQTFSIFVILFFTPLFGLPIYLLIRPGSTLIERYYEEEEIGGSEDEDEWEEFYHCPGCKHYVSRDFRYCPKCAFELTVSCPSCKKQIHTDWTLCPYCGEKDITPVKWETQKKPKGKKTQIPKEDTKDKEV